MAKAKPRKAAKGRAAGKPSASRARKAPASPARRGNARKRPIAAEAEAAPDNADAGFVPVTAVPAEAAAPGQATTPASAFAPGPGEAPAAPTTAWAGWDAAPPAAAGPRRGAAAPGAIAALVVGLVGLWMLPFGIVLGPVAIGLAVWARRQMRADPALGGRGLATTGLILGAVAFVGGLGFVGFLFATDLFEGVGAKDHGDDVVAVQAGVLSRNADRDAARELAVGLAAWDEDRESPVHFEGTVEAFLESSADGSVWTVVANRSVQVEPPDDEYSPATVDVEFSDVELDREATYRARVRVTMAATGAVFEDLTQPVPGDEMPDYFAPFP